MELCSVLRGSLDGREAKGGEWKPVSVWLSAVAVYLKVSQHCSLTTCVCVSHSIESNSL